MLKVAIAGLGWWGRHLIDVMKSVEDLRAVMGVDPTAEGRAFCDQNGLQYVDDLQKALADPQIDGVILATPHSLHKPQVLAAVAANKAVFCEKPIALNAADAAEMVHAARNAGKVLGIGHERRFEGGFERMAQIIQSGQLGQLSHIDANVSHNSLAKMGATGWRKDQKEAPAGNWTGVGIHLGDLITSFFGPPTSVRSFHNSPYPNLADAVVRVQLAYTDGRSAIVTSIANTPFYARFTVYGDKGWMELVDLANVDKGKPATLTICDADGNRSSETHDPKDAAAVNLRSWARANLFGEPYRFTSEQIVAEAAILEGLVASISQDGKPVSIDVAKSLK
jgi:predicted dehydrogenase